MKNIFHRDYIILKTIKNNLFCSRIILKYILGIYLCQTDTYYEAKRDRNEEGNGSFVSPVDGAAVFKACSKNSVHTVTFDSRAERR